MFNEDTRVKIPTILHLVRLGYKYLSLKNSTWDINTNIFTDIFKQSIAKINPELEADDVQRFLQDVKLTLDNEDLGKAFYEKLTERSGKKLIDFENFTNNSFHVVTELIYKNGDDEFRPDITILINGMPLVFIEVKKPNNRDGIIAERDRINTRFKNSKFRKFVNITQFMIFSNNMEYEKNPIEPLQGAFYASASYQEPKFNFFREEETLNLTALLKPHCDKTEDEVLKDNNVEVIKNSPEFALNKEPCRPTNSICTSLLNRDRLAFILRFALTYVDNKDDSLQKHIMRYPQIFATKAIEQKLDEGIKKGIIWHTQGSGKTALAFYNVKFLTAYFQRQNIIPKFYFIVDRIDLLNQAHREFTSRYLTVKTISSKEDFAKEIKQTKVISNDRGKPEITVVNIHKFKDDPNVIKTHDYNVEIQRIFFLDEVHRSYNPKGSFLASLYQADRNAIKIGLTGTPILNKENAKNKKSKQHSSKQLFGDYIHTYYYNRSIADGYTLRLVREEIATQYKQQMQEALQEIEVKQGDIKKEQLYAHKSFVEPMLEYMITDFEKSRKANDDNSIGGMVICDSSNQAKALYANFQEQYANRTKSNKSKDKHIVNRAALILHDIGSKDERDDWVKEFKAGKIDFLFVYNMLLTGFDANRLKKLYIGRKIKTHNLLQALTRVNRPYKKFRYGYVVDFADISQEFEETNKAYFQELQSELGDELENYSKLFKPHDEIKTEIAYIKDVLFKYNTANAESFSDDISKIEDKGKLSELAKALTNAKELYNLIRLQGDYELLELVDFKQLHQFLKMVNDRTALLNLKDNLEKGDTANLLNIALEDYCFSFIKVGEEELKIEVDNFKDSLRKAREALLSNFDPKDPKFITLKEELERIFKNKNLSELTTDDLKNNTDHLNKIYKSILELNRSNNALCEKYSGDKKYTCIHKRLNESKTLGENEHKIHEALTGIKHDIDELVLNNSQVIENESYFERNINPAVINHVNKKQGITLTPDSTKYVTKLISNEYINEYLC